MIERIFKDVAAKQPLREFQIAKRINAEKPRSSLVRVGGAISDALILKPSVMGFGVDLKELIKSFKFLAPTMEKLQLARRNRRAYDKGRYHAVMKSAPSSILNVK